LPNVRWFVPVRAVEAAKPKGERASERVQREQDVVVVVSPVSRLVLCLLSGCALVTGRWLRRRRRCRWKKKKCRARGRGHQDQAGQAGQEGVEEEERRMRNVK
jgi:hypothetical protein